ncbi:hypothetical protein VTO42DRAFT_7657 [Malbranchea cinnamomea]
MDLGRLESRTSGSFLQKHSFSSGIMVTQEGTCFDYLIMTYRFCPDILGHRKHPRRHLSVQSVLFARLLRGFAISCQEVPSCIYCIKPSSLVCQTPILPSLFDHRSNSCDASLQGLSS